MNRTRRGSYLSPCYRGCPIARTPGIYTRKVTPQICVGDFFEMLPTGRIRRIVSVRRRRPHGYEKLERDECRLQVAPRLKDAKNSGKQFFHNIAPLLGSRELRRISETTLWEVSYETATEMS